MFDSLVRTHEVVRHISDRVSLPQSLRLPTTTAARLPFVIYTPSPERPGAGAMLRTGGHGAEQLDSNSLNNSLNNY